jgi:hypothetical protein
VPRPLNIELGGTGRNDGQNLRGTAYVTPKDAPFNAAGDGVTDDTAAWQAWSAYVQANGLRGYIPQGIYLIDSWTVTTRGSVFEGANQSSVTLTNGVKIKARSTVTNFVTWESDDSRLANVEIDGNNKATNPLRIANQTFDFIFDRVYVGGAVDNGINVNLSGTTTNTQVAEGSFYDCFVFGSGSRAGTGATGITNVKINSDQSLVISFHRCKFQGNDTNGSDVLEQINIPLGTCSFFGCFWTQGNASGHDVRIGNGGSGGGSVGFYDCRSESSLSDSIYVDGGSGDVVLSNFVHATSTMTSITATTNFTGRITGLGGQYNNISNASATAEVSFFNHKMFSTGSYQGTYANRICKLEAGTMQMRLLQVQAAAGTMVQFTDTTNSKNAYFNWNNNVLTQYRDGPSENYRIDGSGNFIPIVTTSPPTLGVNQQLVMNLTTNTNLRFSVRGTDGTTRTANITLA